MRSLSDTMNNFLRDLRYGWRTLTRNPGFAVVAILTIGIGIGASTTIFSWMRSMLLNPLPGAAQPERIVMIENTAPDGAPLTSSYLDFRDFRDNLKLVNFVTARNGNVFSVGDAPRTTQVWGELVSGGFFDMLGIQPEAGRFFSEAERDDAQNAHAVVVISHSYWKNHYRSDRSAVGATLRINRTPFTIIGVAPEGFHGTRAGLDYEMWMPVTMYGQLTHTGTWMLRDRNTRNFMMMARLAPGVTMEQARGEAQALANRMAVSDADSNQGIGAVVLPVWQSHFGTQSILLTPIAILMGASGVVLLIVCANLANLLLARATGRLKEFSVRLAMGARPLRLIQQLLTETLLMAVSGAVCGLMLANLLGGALRWLLPGVARPAMLQPPLDGQVLAFTTALAFGVAILAGLAPALHASRGSVNEMLKEGGRSGSAGAHSHRLRGLLVVSEVALAVVALVGAGLFLKSFETARAMNPGFTPEGVALGRFDFSTAGYDAQQTDGFCRRLRERLEQQPGVTAVSYDDSPPLGFSGGNWETLEVEGYVPGPNENMKIYRDLVSPGYFETMKIPIVEGRDFDLRDEAKSLKVMIVNQEFVRRFLANRSVIGRKVHGWGEWFTIVGVAKDSKYHRVTESPEPYFYIPMRQIFRPEYSLTFDVRTAGSVNEAIAGLRREATAIDPALTIFDAEPMTEYVAASLFGAKVAASLLSVLSGLGLLLAAIGLYSVMAYAVAQRTGEIGIRVTLGAQPRDIMRLVVRQGIGFALVGLVVGSLTAAALARVVAATLVGVGPADPAVYAAATGFTVLVTLASAAIPAWRALRVDPAVALRWQ
ncbi:MAG TPA: ABC transporter permease [Candidatus Saccharimonadales bacterium]|nr:ABC transporter permease [Candidatus Saccharimonadales bacterium]